MRPRPLGAPVLIAGLLASLACTSAHATSLGQGPHPASGPYPIVSVADYLAAFAAAYQPDAYSTVLLLDSEAAVQRAGMAMAPAVTFEQSLDWDAYSALGLELGTRLRLPLYDSRAGQSQALADVDHQAARATVAAARADAELAFFVDLASYAALAEAEAGLAPALLRFGTAPGLMDPQFDPRALAQDERSLYEAHLRLLAMHAFLVDQLTEVESRITRLLQVADERLIAPPHALIAAALPPPPDTAACLSTAPAAGAARLRHRRATLATARDATAPITVELTGDVALIVGGAAAAGGPSPWVSSATLALEARVGLPPARAFWQDWDATISATASSTGASQSLRISWPRALHPTFDPDPDADLANELHDVGVTLRTLSRAVAQASSERARIQRSLDWLLLDNFGSALSDQPDATATTSRPTAAALQAALPLETPLGLAAQIADLSAQLAFAELDEVIAAAQLASACGSWP